MKTQIKTKELLSLVDPTKDGIVYNENTIKVNIETLSEYVNKPKSMNIFEKSTDPEINFYKNAALYIINSEKNKRFISINLDNKNIFEDGLFEFIKSIYNKESQVIVSLPETGDNLLLIQAKKLLPISKDITVKDKNPEKALDIALGELSSIFLQTAKVSKEELEKSKVTEKDKFFWKEESADLYSNKEFLLDKVKEILKGEKYGKNSTIEVDFYNLIKKANNDYVYSDEFKLELLNLNDVFLNKMLLTSKYESIFPLDFSKPIFQAKILDDIKNNRFTLLEKLYNRSKSYDKTKADLGIDFTSYINMPETIKHLKEKYYSKNHFTDDRNFGMASCYPLLTRQNQLEESIVSKYLDCITNTTMNGDKYITNTYLFQIPAEKFNEEPFLSKVLPLLNFREFKQFLENNNITNSLISSPDFLVKNAYNLQSYKIANIIYNFHKKETITKDFVLDMIENKPDFYITMSKDNKERRSVFAPFINDINVIFSAYSRGLKVRDISLEVMTPHFINNDSSDIEQFKLKYLVTIKSVGKNGKKFYNNPTDASLFDEKYNKLEYLFFKTDDWHHSDKSRDKALSKLKTKEQVVELLEKTDALYLGFDFDAKSFYSAIHPNLKNDLELVKDIASRGNLTYSHLSESLQYNQKAALWFIENQNAQDTINKMPKEFFNDIHFSLEFSKLMDSGIVGDKETPHFISKFFDNQGVKEDYYSHLKSYIAYNSIKENMDLDKEDASQPKKKMKI